MDTEAAHFHAEIRDGTAWAVFNRPRSLNAFSFQMREEIIRFLGEVEHDPKVRCVVLSGAGDHFMAGGDVKSFTEQFDQSPAERRAHFEAACHAMHPIIYRLRRLPKPVVASVRGACAGLGLSLVLASDLAIAAEKAFFTLAYARIGTTPDGGASYFLPRTVGMKRAMEIALLSDRFDAQKALQFGILNWVVPDADLEKETIALAGRLSRSAPHAVARTKALLADALSRDLEAHLQAEAVSFGACAATSEMAEGVAAFLEKRDPQFSRG
ncbi:enoyl-CoA hydratase/isomerase family protein [Afifella sp. IM 167]|uniref:enoyl-CoA hydratase/isomerase family protein n=1 Tax=Afifella sp. IM 167 TaxID=2033586 RepID=UPI001CCA9601|nr:enoyl-CoA hydratase-related protein [Afifella sp. IM 167]MBZ8134791.1 enoyl-CoA hydratase [Afifella sp. IM 167]